MTTIATVLISLWSIPIALYIVMPMLVILTLFFLDLHR